MPATDFDTTPDWLKARAAQSASRPFLVIQDQTISFARLDYLVDVAAETISIALQGHQSHAADNRIAVLMGNNLSNIVALHAVWRLGGIAVPLNTRLTDDEQRWQVERSRCIAVICDANHTQTRFDVQTILFEHKSISAPVQSSADTAVRPLEPFDLARPCLIIHTSGTTGRPKGAVLSLGNLFYSAMASAYRIGVLPDDRWLSVLPLFHIGGISIIVRSILYGTSVDLLERFDAETVNQCLRDRPISLISLVPTMLLRLLDMLDSNDERWNSHLRLILLGGSAASPELIQRAQRHDLPIALTYGLSEASSQVSTALPATVQEKPGSVGKPLYMTEVRIVDDTGRVMEAETVGEVIVRGKTVMLGYDSLTDDTATVANADETDWLHTGDVGRLDSDGDLWIFQRRSDLIVSGGENVYPAEVEAVVRSHPGIADCAVIGIDDPQWGQRVAAVVVTHDNTTADPAMRMTDTALMDYCRDHLAGYKIPRVFRYADALPLNATGKVDRTALRHLFADE